MTDFIAPSIVEKARNLLVDEGSIALQQMKSAIEFIWHLRPPGVDYLVDSGEMINALRRLVWNFGLASTILFDDGGKRPRENEGMFALRQDRVAFVKERTKSIDTAVFAHRSVRNKFAHVDEHMTRIMLDEQGLWVLNIGLGTRRMVVCPDGPIHYCRVYIFDEDRLLHLREELPLRPLYEATIAVIDALPPTHNQGVRIDPGPTLSV